MTTQTATNKTLTIAVDLDNTTGDYEGALRKKIAEILGVDEAEHMNLFPAVKDYAMGNNGWYQMDTQEKFFELHSKAVENGLFAEMEAYEGASEVLWRLHDQGHFIRIITARFLKRGDRGVVIRTTGEFLDKNDIPVDDIAFTERKTEVEADVYIDDSPGNIEKLRAKGKTVIIFDQAYNQGFDGLRAKNWQDVERILNELSVA